MNEHQRTWVGKVVEDKVPLQSLLDSCLKNVDEAARKESKLRDEYMTLPAGHPRLVGTKDEMPMAHQIRVAIDDQRHWREYVAYYRERIAKEGAATMATIKRTRHPQEPRSAPQAPPQPRQPERQAGDDSEEEEVPF